LGLAFFGLVAGAGALVAYSVRVQILVGETSRGEAFTVSAVSSWAVLVFAPFALGFWRFVAEPLAREWWTEGASWPITAQITAAVVYVEVIVWWLSHLLSVRGLRRGRTRYLGHAPAHSGAPGQDVVADVDQRVAAAAGEP
jgi:hypothetical protein